MKKLRDLALGFVIVNLLWLAAAAVFNLRAFPGPLYVYASIGQVLSGRIWLHIGASLFRVLAGLIISVCVGLPLGLLMGRSAVWNRLLGPLVYFTYPIPKTALLPVAMLLFGLGNGSKVLIIVLTVVFQVIVAVRGAAAAIDPDYYCVAISAGLKKWSILRQVTLPAVLAELLTTLRISVGTSLAVLFIVEAYGTRLGVGYYILDAWSRLNYVQMYGGILVISALGALLFWAVDVAAGRALRWMGQ